MVMVVMIITRKKTIYKWKRPKNITTRRVYNQNQEQSLGEHYDQSHSNKGLQTIQSSICYIDQDPDSDDRHFACIPYSHSSIHDQMTKDIYRGQFS